MTETKDNGDSAFGPMRDAVKGLRKREDKVQLREAAALVREAAVSGREDAALAKAGFDAHLMDQLREANENLVVATLRSQTMTEAAERANVMKEQFLAMLAHELRNPLAPIVNALEVLHRVKTPDPKVVWAHDIIKRQVTHLTRLINDLLDVSRINTGKIELKQSPVTVEDIMRQAVEISGPAIANRNQSLTVYIPDRPLTVHGDAVRLVQVFANLLNNAWKYTPEGGTIKFSAQHQENGTVLLRVADDGCGIAADALPNVFELFTQENRSLARSAGGLGIGLTVARGIIELHGGTISAKSGGPGKGSEFAVSLPLMESASSKVALRAHLSTVSPRARYRIVVIEDNIDTSASMKTLLEVMGHEVRIATEGAAGVRLVLETRPQIVLCDIGLPVMDGYAVVQRLRAEMQHPQPIMIAATGYGEAADAAHSAAAGFDAHVVKPVILQDLLRLIAVHAHKLLPS